MSDNPNILHWYDFLCPFCYVGQSRTAILRRHGLDVVELPFQAHPGIPANGVPVGPRTREMYSSLEREAKEAGLVLNWPSRLPNTLHALTAAEWVRRHQPHKFASFQKALFAAHFVAGEDLGNAAIIKRHAAELGIDLDAFRAAWLDGSALAAVNESEELGREHGVRGTPAWLIAQRLISGLLPASEFERLAEICARTNKTLPKSAAT
jgi:predicted DsbA family dithiol-disulfide isomerase